MPITKTTRKIATKMKAVMKAMKAMKAMKKDLKGKKAKKDKTTKKGKKGVTHKQLDKLFSSEPGLTEQLANIPKGAKGCVDHVGPGVHATIVFEHIRGQLAIDVDESIIKWL